MIQTIKYVLILLALWASQSQAAQDDDPLDLEHRSFELTTRITGVLASTDYIINEVNERYSASQRRAKIRTGATHITLKESDNREVVPSFQARTYYVDRSTKHPAVLFMEDGVNESKISSKEAIHKQLAFHEMNGFQGAPDNSHIMGAAQMLMMIARSKHKLQIEKSEKVRNMVLRRYRLDWLNYAALLVYFHEKENINELETIPVRVVYHGRAWITFDFSPIKWLQDDDHSSTLQRQVGNGQVAFDQMIFPLASGCSHLTGLKGEDLLTSHRTMATKFSFIARVNHKHTRRGNMKRIMEANYKTFVAYDASLHSMRVDTLESDWPTSPGRLLYNFNTNKVYTLRADQTRDRRKDQTPALDNVFDLDRSYSTDCVIGKVKGTDLVEVEMKLGELLTGAEDSFVYLGRAQVRGISALVYEVAGSKLPLWLDPEPADEYRKLNDDDGHNPTGTMNTILYYFSEQHDNRPLVMMEIYQHDKEDRKRVHSHRLIDIFEFKWDLESIAPNNGDRSTEMFSLADLCADTQSPSSQVDLVLEQVTPDVTADWLNTASLRNQLVLVALHDSLKLSAANVFDLETRVVKSGDKNTIYVAFRHAPHPLKVKKVAYLGQGKIKPNRERSVNTFVVLSFRDCFLLAARRQNDIFVAFDPVDKFCLIDEQRIENINYDGDTHSFELGDKTLDLQIFKVYLAFSSNGEFLAGWTEEGNSEARYHHQGKELELGYQESGRHRPEFRIKSLFVKDNGVRLEEHQPLVSSDETNKKPFEHPLSEIQGYGLSLDDFEFNKLMDSIEVDSKIVNPLAPGTSTQETHEFEMTPSHCHAKCLTDPDCQSYSLCTINYKVQCILSKMSFKSPQILRELKASTKTKSGHQISVTAHDVQANKTLYVKLVKRPSCTVYNKRFMDLFKMYTRKSTYLLAMGNINAVRSRDECAAQCAQRNFQLNSRFSKMTSEEMFQVSNKRINEPQLDKQKTWLQSIEDEICYTFWYITSDEVRNLAENVRATFKSVTKVQENISGYCIMSKTRAERLEVQKLPEAKRNQLAEVESYFFQLANLYEETRGVALKSTMLNGKQMYTLDRLQTNQSPSSEEVDQLRSMVEGGENFQDFSRDSDRDKCAQLCFMQSVNPWPACRSFDVIVERREASSVLRCRFNSATLKQLVASGKDHLIENQKYTGNELRHYEPRLGLLMDSFALANELESSLMAQRLSSGHFQLLFVVLLALVSGLWVGVVIHRKYLSSFKLRNSDRQRTNSISELVLENNDNYELKD